MEYSRLGSSGLQISTITLGCMSLGNPNQGTRHSPWALDKEAARPIIAAALEAGVTTFDTANVYSEGTSEEVLGDLLAELAPREDVVIATKVHNRVRPGPYGAGLSRKAILHEIDASLRRLGTEYVDLYQIHRWDYETPIEETMETLHDLVRVGKTRHIGASAMYAWQFAKAQYTADLGGWTRFISMQNHYNLLYREEEREMLPFCADQGVGVIPFSPLARGRLTRGWDETTIRAEVDATLHTRYGEQDRHVVERVSRVAETRGVARAQVALAWLLAQPTVTSPIVGITRLEHLTDFVAATELALDHEELAYLGEGYVAHPVSGPR